MICFDDAKQTTKQSGRSDKMPDDTSALRKAENTKTTTQPRKTDDDDNDDANTTQRTPEIATH